MKREAGPVLGRSAWPAATASLMFAATAFYLFSLYSHVHWRVLSSQARFESTLNDELREAMSATLARLEWYRLLAVVAVGWALWA